MIVDERMEHLFNLLLLGRAFFCMARCCETLFSTYTFSFLETLCFFPACGFGGPKYMFMQEATIVRLAGKGAAAPFPPLPHQFPPSSGLSGTMKLITEDSFSLVPSS
jgi:hypothetical protein